MYLFYLVFIICITIIHSIQVNIFYSVTKVWLILLFKIDITGSNLMANLNIGELKLQHLLQLFFD